MHFPKRYFHSNGLDVVIRNSEMTSFSSVWLSRAMAVFMGAKVLSLSRPAAEGKADWVIRTDKSRSDDNRMEILGILLQSKPLEIIQPALC
jgi:hypothetical protein